MTRDPAGEGHGVAAPGALGILAAAALAAACGRIGFDTTSVDVDGSITHECRAWTPFSAPERIAGVSSTTVDDWAPSVTADGLELVFASWRAGNSHIWLARRNSRDDDFSEPDLVAELATANGEYSPRLSPDGSKLVFVSFGPSGPWDLWLATRPDRTAPFDPPRRLTEVSSSASEHSPWLSPDGLRLYFTSDRGGPWNVWLATRADPSGPFDPPAQLTEVSSTANERTVALTSDERELYIASTREGGAGGYDLWVARRPDREAPFAEPDNLAELNTAFDDIYALPSFDGVELYLNVDTEIGGGRRSDLWVATRSCVP